MDTVILYVSELDDSVSCYFSTVDLCDVHQVKLAQTSCPICEWIKG